jgi:hypothetical protein
MYGTRTTDGTVTPTMMRYMALAPFQPIVADFQTDTIRVSKKRGPIVRCVVRVKIGFGRFNAGIAQTLSGRNHVCY